MLKINRELGILVNKIIDDFLPPVIRDSNLFLPVIFQYLFKNKAEVFLNFRQKAFLMSSTEFFETYQKADSVLFTSMNRRVTDLNKKCVKKILSKIKGKTVLEVGVGKGYLSNLLSNQFGVTGVDILIDKSLIKKYPQINFVRGNIESLPFEDKKFDTVICAHTLEHVPNITNAVKELRRVVKKRLIIVLPKERPYRFGFNLHLHFFPYEYSVMSLFGFQSKSKLFNESGDWFYVEDI